MDDNIRFPKKQVEAQGDAVIALGIVEATKEKYKPKDIVNVLVGKTNALITSHKTHTKPFFV